MSVLNMYASNTRISKFIKETLLKLKSQWLSHSDSVSLQYSSIGNRQVIKTKTKARKAGGN